MPLFQIDRNTKNRKAEVLSYFRSRGEELLAETTAEVGSGRPKEIAKRINPALTRELDALTAQVRQQAATENWNNNEILKTILLLTHCTNVVMIDSRNSARPYEYMDFSRRVGERWENLCALCFQYPSLPIKLFTPPLFSDVKKRLHTEIRDYLAKLNISDAEHDQLVEYYEKVWIMVDSGAIKLSLDVHFINDPIRYVVDFKSGFGSNEKGNTNRLLIVGSIYRNIEPEDYRCLMLVRSPEEMGNQYLQTLKNSGIWEVFCCQDAYEQISYYTGFPFASWVKEYITWQDDLSGDTYSHLAHQGLLGYLEW